MKIDYLNNNCFHYFGKIYHYTSADGIIGILREEQLWFTNIYFLNDRNEIFYTYELVKEILKELSNQIDKKLANKIKQRCNYMLDKKYFRNEKEIWYRTEYYIASFSTDSDNIALWNYYTKSDITGYNLEFFPSTFDSTNLVAKGKVCYDNELQKQLLKEIILNCNEKYANSVNEKENIVLDLYENLIIYSLFFKDNLYKVENEYRIIMSVHNVSNEEKECCYRQKNGLIIPYINFSFKEKAKNYTKNGRKLINHIKISPINQGEITKYGLERLKSTSNIPIGDISFSSASMRF